MLKRKGLCLVLAAVTAISISFIAMAADTKIDKVNLTFSYDTAPATGDAIGDIMVKADSGEFYVESAEYTNSEDQDTWTVGDVPQVKVELSAKDGYRFSYTSKSHFNLTGCNAEYKKVRIYDSGSSIEVYAQLKRIGGKLEGASNPEWQDTSAVWDEVEGSKSYDVKLLRDDRTVATVSTSGTSYDFAGYFNREGDYTFRVRAVSKYNNKTGEWSEDSDSFYVNAEDLGSYGGNGRWAQDQKGWWYSYDTGGYPLSCWKEINGSKYYFNSAGYMVTGWQKLDGIWYYMNPSGAMTTGWQNINGTWYYLDASGKMQTGWQAVNGTWYFMNNSGAMQTGWFRLDNQWYYLNGSGAMTTGWQDVNGKWYYMGGNGVMYANTWTPDGRYVDSSGALVQ